MNTYIIERTFASALTNTSHAFVIVVDSFPCTYWLAYERVHGLLLDTEENAKSTVKRMCGSWTKRCPYSATTMRHMLRSAGDEPPLKYNEWMLGMLGVYNMCVLSPKKQLAAEFIEWAEKEIFVSHVTGGTNIVYQQSLSEFDRVLVEGMKRLIADSATCVGLERMALSSPPLVPRVDVEPIVKMEPVEPIVKMEPAEPIPARAIVNTEAGLATIKQEPRGEHHWDGDESTGYVYIVTTLNYAHQHVYNIGYTKRPEQRLEALNEHRIDDFFQYHTLVHRRENALNLKLYIHHRFAEQRIKNDFFHLEQDGIDDILMILDQY